MRAFLVWSWGRYEACNCLWFRLPLDKQLMSLVFSRGQVFKIHFLHWFVYQLNWWLRDESLMSTLLSCSFWSLTRVQSINSAYQLYEIDHCHSQMWCWSEKLCIYMSINQWSSKLLVSQRKALKCYWKKCLQYFTVVEQFLLQFVKINKYQEHSS